jgi:hypothetical protein
MIKIENCTLIAGEVGIKSDFPVEVSETVISAGQSGIHLIGERAVSPSRVAATTITAPMAIQLEAQIGVQLSDEHIKEILEILRSSKDAEERASRLEKSKVGRFIGQQRTVEWLTFSATLGAWATSAGLL